MSEKKNRRKKPDPPQDDFGFDVEEVKGDPKPLVACPVCGGLGEHTWNCSLDRSF